MPKQTLGRLVWLLCLAFALMGCKEKIEIVEEIRAIKTVTVSEQVTERILKFSGLVAAVDSSDLSFQVGGQVASVSVDIGDQVKKGQVLAVLDPEPYQLDVDKAAAQLGKAREQVNESKSQLDRQQRIYDQGAGVKSHLEAAAYNLKAAENEVKIQVARLELARRNLRKTSLFSPYYGTIAWRSMEPNEEVQAGQKVFEINAKGKMEVHVAVPENAIDYIYIDDAVTVTFPTVPGESTQGRISDIGSAAIEANAFPVKVALVGPNRKVKPGMSAEARFSVQDEDRKAGFKLPLQAILPAAEANQGYVFVYDPRASTVKKNRVRYSGLTQAKVIVTDGVAVGDIIAVAGVSFLADGLHVKLMKQ